MVVLLRGGGVASLFGTLLLMVAEVTVGVCFVTLSKCVITETMLSVGVFAVSSLVRVVFAVASFVLDVPFFVPFVVRSVELVVAELGSAV